MSALGRHVPPDFEHVERYPLAAAPSPPKGVPVVIGVNWYAAFDDPQRNSQGHWWIGRASNGNLGNIRGGHCVALEPVNDPQHPGVERDASSWHVFYNQGQEGSCVGHGCARLVSLLNRKRYDAVSLYRQAQAIDGTKGAHDGTTVRAGLEILRTSGPQVAHGDVTTHLRSSDPPDPAQGISAYRWATTVDEVLAALGTPGLDHVTLLNSWGSAYPERVFLPATVLERLLSEQGEAGVATDR